MADATDRDRFASLVTIRFSRRAAIRIAATGAGLALAAPGSVRAVPTAAQEAKPLVIGRNIDDVMTLDPSVASEETYTLVLRSCYDRLLSPEPDDATKLVPMLAESWEVSPDAMTFTFKLKPDAVFASGNPVTSADVKFSFDRLREMKSQVSYQMDPVASVEAPDPQTVIVTLKNPDATFLQALTSASFSVMDSAVVKEHGGTSEPGADQTDKASQWLTGNSAGSGPYVLAGYTPKDRITLKRNPNGLRPAHIDDVLIQSAPDSSALKQMLEKGDVDIAWGLLTEQLEALKGNPDIAEASTPMLGFLALGMTCDPSRNKAVADPKVRQALKYAVDYDGIRSLRDGALTPASIIPIGLEGALDPETDGIKRDLDKARQLLSEAGYGDGFKATLSSSSTEILGGVQDSILGEKLQADFGELGIDITLDPIDEAIFRPKYRAGEIELVISGWYVGYPAPFDILDNWGPGGTVPVDRLRWNPTDHPAAALLTQARQTVDDAKRVDLLQQAQRELIKDAPYTVLIQPVFSYPYRADLTGVVANPFWNIDPSTVQRGS